MIALVTGAAGFVGTNLSRRLLEKGHKVVGVDSLSRGGVNQNLGLLKTYTGFTFHKREIEDAPSVIASVKPDLVYHFAAQVAVTSSEESPRRDFLINAKGTLDVVLAARDAGAPVIYTSTNKVYGDGVNDVPIREEALRYDFKGELRGKGIPANFSVDSNHHSPYGVSKLVGDLYVREFGGIANRCSCMYGPNQFGIVDQGWLSHIAQRIIKGEDVTVFGNGKQLRDALHSHDVSALLEKQGQALLDKANVGGQAYNVGGGYDNTISILELLKHWKAPEDKIKFGPWRPADQRVFYCDISKTREAFDWKPTIPVYKGIEELFSWTEKSLSS